MNHEKPSFQGVSVPSEMWDRARMLALLTGKPTVSKFLREGIDQYLKIVEDGLPESQRALLNAISSAKIAEEPPAYGKKAKQPSPEN